MHICFICHEYPKSGFANGGLGSFVKTIAPQLVQNGLRVTVVGMNFTGNYEHETDNGVTIFRLPRKNIKGLSWLINAVKLRNKIKSIHQEHPIDIIESPELGLAFLKKYTEIKYVIRLHGGHHFFAEAEKRGVNPWKGFQEKRSFGKADAFVAVSEYVRTHTAKFLSYHGKPVELINYPIDTETFSPTSVDSQNGKIIFAGTVCEKKGVRQLIMSFPKVNAEFPAAKLHLYGRDWFYADGRSYTQEMKELVATMPEHADSIIFEGPVPYADIATIYSSAEVCVFPSHMETQGLVAPEAMAVGRPVVFTNAGPGPETVVPFETGLLCDPYDPQDIADKICWVLSDRERASAMAIRGRKAVIGKFGAQPIIMKNLEFYQRLVKSKK